VRTNKATSVQAETSNSVFVTGTDTGVGKTRVACELIKQRVALGLRVVAFKPIAAGLIENDRTMVSEDVLAHEAFVNVRVPRALTNPYSFVAPIAPHIAAHDENIVIDIHKIITAYRAVEKLADCVVVEGAGGLLVPLNMQERLTQADLISALTIPVILVVGMRLGCLNHALLTVEALQRRGLNLQGWVANECAGAMPRFEDNLATLQRMIDAPCVDIIRYQLKTD
jgi:dethiobiotin synthetase